MAYKVQRREFIRYQPKWLFHFLLALSPKVYETMETLGEARANLQQVKDAIIENDLQRIASRHLITIDDDIITFGSLKGKLYLKFYIQENNKRKI